MPKTDRTVNRVFAFRRNLAGIDFRRFSRKTCPMTIQTPPTPSSFPQASQRLPVAFQRQELGVIMGLYGRMVAAGEWRDYGMSFLSDVAIFSVFRRAAEVPLYRIEKRPALRLKQGQYSVLAMDGRILKRGPDLKQVLRVLERKLIRPVS